MKRIAFLLVSVMLLAATLSAQNIQLNYDLRRECFTTTVEIFKPDKLGSLFTFIDFNYENQGDSAGVRNASMGYWEIARYFTISAVPKLSATIQYNDGLTNRYSFNPVWLGGVQYAIGGKKFSLPIDFLIP
ncbi:MAG: DUF5020 family protein, partial [Candidatus Marinimicrobia bacterium]|nr:DUF5020 family protein [Candidatus Neomarinimicrobiota bacterium]